MRNTLEQASTYDHTRFASDSISSNLSYAMLRNQTKFIVLPVYVVNYCHRSDNFSSYLWEQKSMGPNYYWISCGPLRVPWGFGAAEFGCDGPI